MGPSRPIDQSACMARVLMLGVAVAALLYGFIRMLPFTAFDNPPKPPPPPTTIPWALDPARTTPPTTVLKVYVPVSPPTTTTP